MNFTDGETKISEGEYIEHGVSHIHCSKLPPLGSRRLLSKVYLSGLGLNPGFARLCSPDPRLASYPLSFCSLVC